MPARDRLKLRHLHGLVAVAEHGSLVRAAERLSVTQPAVSKMLAELEEIVGHRLVERGARGVRLTGAGRLLLRYAGSSLRTLQDGLDTLARAGELDAPVIVIGALPNVAATVLPPALLRFAADVPQARVQVRSGSNAQLIALLRQGALDLVIGRLAEPSEMQGLAFEQLYTERLLFVVRPGHAYARRRRLPAQLLRSCRLVLPDAGTRIREAADRFFLASGAGLPEDVLETIDPSFARSYVLQSDAVWCVPTGVVEGDLREGRLALLPLDTQVTEGPVGLTQRVDRVPSDALRLLVEQVRRGATERAASAAGSR
ncbi:MAG TPA: pca operon transcription factor PcaQ [Ramlibacter sp.]|nr:pca operon transcription factor PcaQ [Ramlibacter sp.]